MSFNFHNQLSSIWEKAVSLYKEGNTDPSSFPIEDVVPMLASFGINKIEVFDYAEDWCLHGEPDLLTFLLVHYERWSFFREEQNRKPSNIMLEPTSLPSRSEEIAGIQWLPRIIPKAYAKLRGELPPEVMYGCGGDRQFFKQNNIHPAEFLRIIRKFPKDEKSIINWVHNKKTI